jgi:DNA polymerase III delta prime subunit
MPHLILTVIQRIISKYVIRNVELSPEIQGAPGIGKTTCVLALAREMLGDSFKEGVLELNASDER